LKSNAIKIYFDKREEFLKYLIIFLYLTVDYFLQDKKLITLKYKNTL